MDGKSKHFLGNRVDILKQTGICLAALIVFVLVFGTQILNPAYTDWLLDGGDGTQHYIGSVAFRQSPWFFPIGLMNTLNYPGTASVVFTDSIPIAAIFFKFIAGIFPATWQYQGFWILSCLVLQAFFAGKILREYTDRFLIVLLGSILFTISPIMMFRFDGHETLGAQWLILCAFLLLVKYKSKYYSLKPAVVLTTILGFITPGIHMYFLLMCGLVVVGYCVYDVLSTRRIRNTICVLAAYVGAAFVQIGLLGGFGQGDVRGGGLGNYAFELNGFINSMWTSDYVKAKETVSREGFAYLGIGQMGMIAFALVGFLSYGCQEWKKLNFKLTIACAVIAALSLILALSPVIHFASNIVCELSIPDFLKDLWSIFRATGRIIWPFYYLLVLLGLIGNLKWSGKRKTALLLCLCLMIQCREFRTFYAAKNKDNRAYDSGLQEEKWNEVIQKTGSGHLTLIGNPGAALLCETEYKLGVIAMNHQMTMNRFWMVHGLYGDEYQEHTYGENGEPYEETLYVFFSEEDRNEEVNLNYYLLDDYVIGTVFDLGTLGLPEINSKAE